MHPQRKPFMHVNVVRNFSTRAKDAMNLMLADCPPHRCVVLDPLDPSNNLARNVSFDVLCRMKKACERGCVALGDTLSDANLGRTFAQQFFNRSYEQLRLGSDHHWRPDHVVHPRQDVVSRHITKANLLPRLESFESELMPCFTSFSTDKKPDL